MAQDHTQQTLTDEQVPDVIDLGCGNNPIDGAVGVDMRDYPAADVQRDIRNLPDHWEDGVERAHASQVFEHLTGEAIAEALAEVSRVLKPGGVFEFDVPFGRAYDGDPTHETRWYFQTIVYYLPRDEVERLGWDPETFPDYYQPEHDIDLVLEERDAVAWLDVTSLPLRPLSFAVRYASNAITTDKWEGLPHIGGLAAGALTFKLRRPEA